MIFDSRWKYIFAEGVRPMLLDLETDPGAIRNASLGEAKAGILIGYRNQEELRPVLDPEAGTAPPHDILICGSE